MDEPIDMLLLNMVEAAQLVRTSVDGIRSLIKRHQIPVMKFPGQRRVLVRRRDLVQYLQQASVR
jgi:excisionase family DNA binding protein